MKSRSRRRKSKSRSKRSKRQTRSRSKQLRTRASIRKKSKSKSKLRKINSYNIKSRRRAPRVGWKRHERSSPRPVYVPIVSAPTPTYVKHNSPKLFIKRKRASQKEEDPNSPFFVTNNDKLIDENNSYVPSFKELYIEYPYNTRVSPRHPFLKDPNHKIIYEIFQESGNYIVVQTSQDVSIYNPFPIFGSGAYEGYDNAYEFVRKSPYESVLPGIDYPEPYKSWNVGFSSYTEKIHSPRHGNDVMINFGNGRYETHVAGAFRFSSPVTHFYSLFRKYEGYPFWFTEDGWVYRFYISVYRSKNSKYNNSPKSILSLNVDDNPVWDENFQDNKVPYSKTSFFD